MLEKEQKGWITHRRSRVATDLRDKSVLGYRNFTLTHYCALGRAMHRDMEAWRCEP